MWCVVSVDRDLRALFVSGPMTTATEAERFKAAQEVSSPRLDHIIVEMVDRRHKQEGK